MQNRFCCIVGDSRGKILILREVSSNTRRVFQQKSDFPPKNVTLFQQTSDFSDAFLTLSYTPVQALIALRLFIYYLSEAKNTAFFSVHFYITNMLTILTNVYLKYFF